MSNRPAPPPAPRGAAWRPYRFADLPKVPRSQIHLLQQLQWLLPEGLLTGELGDHSRELLHNVFDEDVALQLVHATVLAPGDLTRFVADPTFLAVVASAPNAARGLIELELALAHSLIDLLLGTPGESAAMRPLTDIEQGVMTYVLLEAFKALGPTETNEPDRARLRLERTIASIEEGLLVFEQESMVALVELNARIGAVRGYLRLLLPASAIRAAVPPEDSPERRSRRLEHVRRNLKRVAGARAWLRAEVGHADLTAHDLQALGEGDVMLLDELRTRVDQGAAGPAVLRVGYGDTVRIDAGLEVVEGRYQAKIEKFVVGEPAEDAPPDDGEGEQAPASDAAEGEPKEAEESKDEDQSEGGALWDDDDEKTTLIGKPSEMFDADAAELLNDVPLKVVVELARIPVTAEQVVALHPGKIVELNRAPGEPVDLSVNGKVVARGELVEVNGQLGVRITTLT